MRILVGVLVAGSISAGLIPAGLDAIHTAESTVTTMDLQMVSRNAYLFAIQRGGSDVEPADLKRATAFSEYRAADWKNKPVYDAASQRVYAAPHGKACKALELAEHTAPDQSITVVDVEIVERPLEECERVRGSSRP